MKRSRASIWGQAIRPFSFSASVIPVLLGTALAYFETGAVNWIFFAIAMLGGVLLHTGTNLISEYYDLKAGADRPDTFGSSRVLVEKLLNPKDVLNAGLICFAAAFVLGIFLVMELGWVIVALGLTGLLGGYFYTADPLGYKYKALGEPLVFILMGVLMVLGAHYVQTQTLSWIPVLISLPISILVAGILNANNLRDIPHDRRAGFNTLASFGSWAASVKLYKGIVISAFVVLIALVVGKVAPIYTLIALISLLPALKLLRTVGQASPETPADLAMLDVSTAQLHMLFGLLFTIGFVVSRLI